MFATNKELRNFAKFVKNNLPDKKYIRGYYKALRESHPNADLEILAGSLSHYIVHSVFLSYIRKVHGKTERVDMKGYNVLKRPYNALLLEHKNKMPNNIVICKDDTYCTPIARVKIKNNKEVKHVIPYLLFFPDEKSEDDMPAMVFPRIGKWSKKVTRKYEDLGEIIKDTFDTDPALLFILTQDAYKNIGNQKFARLYRDEGITVTYFPVARQQLYAMCRKFERDIQGTR